MTDNFVPWSQEAEEALLGSLLIDGEEIENVLWLKPDDFFRETNHWIFEACLSLTKRQAPIDQLTVHKEIGNKIPNLDALLNHLVAVVPTSLHAKYYAEIIADKSRRRQLVGLSHRLEQAAESAEVPEIISSLIRDANTIGQSVNDISYVSSADMAMEWLGATTPPLIPTGFQSVDSKVGGVGRGEQVIVGAYSGNGKTSLMADMMVRMSANHKALFCSCEMKQHAISGKVIANLSGVSARSIRVNEYTEIESDKIQSAVDKMGRLKFWYMKYHGDATTDKIRNAAANVKAAEGLDIVFVDYIQVLQDRYGNSDRERVSYISRRLAGIAKDLDVTIIAASQFRRAAMHSEPSKENPLSEADRIKSDMKSAPHMWDLKESGSLENDSDLILLLHRPFKPDGTLSSRTYLIIAKNRATGELGIEPMDYIGNTYQPSST